MRFMLNAAESCSGGRTQIQCAHRTPGPCRHSNRNAHQIILPQAYTHTKKYPTEFPTYRKHYLRTLKSNRWAASSTSATTTTTLIWPNGYKRPPLLCNRIQIGVLSRTTHRRFRAHCRPRPNVPSPHPSNVGPEAHRHACASKGMSGHLSISTSSVCECTVRGGTTNIHAEYKHACIHTHTVLIDLRPVRMSLPSMRWLLGPTHNAT